MGGNEIAPGSLLAAADASVLAVKNQCIRTISLTGAFATKEFRVEAHAPSDIIAQKHTVTLSEFSAVAILPQIEVIIAPHLYTDDRIIKALFHPLSQDHLLILSLNGIIRMFDLSKSTDEPEQTFYLCGDPKYKRGIVPNQTEFNAVSFCFGKQSQFINSYSNVGWSEMTIYGLLESGSIVSICPVLPYSCTPPPQLETLIEYARKKGFIDSNQYYWTSKWINDPQSCTIPLKRQGPYLIGSPKNNIIENMDCHNYFDIIVLEHEDCAFHSILVLSSAGILNFISLEFPLNLWALEIVIELIFKN